MLSTLCHGYNFVLKTFTECSNYTSIDDFSRAQAYYGDLPFSCDNTLLPGWYRFTGYTGDQMLETCVDMYYCGTHAPGWLSGGHPLLADGVVQHKVCFSYYSGCCHNSTNITVLNCAESFTFTIYGRHLFVNHVIAETECHLVQVK